ncbi:MAG TPA: alkyl hydroperoxide reductase [Microbacterium sp.]|nr:alkyl hydroperoxide reductase [Microbacterium sp.]
MLGGVCALALAVTLTACTGGGDTLADEYREGSDKGYIAGNYDVVEIPSAERGEPVEFAGVTELGDEVSSEDFAGDVLVVNFWYAACGPCRVEAPLLEAVWQEHEGQDVSFLGVNTYDQADTALAFADTYGITYPSVIDINDKKVGLAFAGATPIQATPTTLVLDGEGRVAARIIGQLQSASILSTLVRDLLAENP